MADPTLILSAKSGNNHGTASYTTGATSATIDGSVHAAVIFYCTNGGGSAPALSTPVDSGGHTWTQRVSANVFGGSGTDYVRVEIWTAPHTGTGTYTMTVDTATGSIYKWGVQIIQLTGTTGFGATASSTDSGTEAASTTLNSTPASSSFILGAIVTYENQSASNAITPGTGWTELAEMTDNYPDGQSQWITGSTSTTVSWANNGTNVGGYAMVALEFTVSGGSTPVGESDSGTGTDSQTITVSITQSDTGAGTDSQTLAVAFTQTDTGAGTDSQSIVVAISSTDTGTGTDAATAGSPVAEGDTFTASESETLSVTITVSDSGSGADSEDADDGDTTVPVSDSDGGRWYELQWIRYSKRNTLLSTALVDINELPPTLAERLG